MNNTDVIFKATEIITGNGDTEWAPLEGRMYDPYPVGYMIEGPEYRVESGCYGWFVYRAGEKYPPRAVAEGHESTERAAAIGFLRWYDASGKE